MTVWSLGTKPAEQFLAGSDRPGIMLALPMFTGSSEIRGE